MNFWKSSYISAITNAITIVVKILVNKITAIYVGPSGFAIYGQFKDLIAMTTTISQLGTENGIIRYTAETQNAPNQFKKFLGNSIAIHLLCSAITAIITICFSKSISELLFDSDAYQNVLNIVITTVFFTAAFNLILSILNGLKQLRYYTYITIIATLVGGSVSAILVTLYHLNGLLYAIAFNNILLFTISFFIVWRYHIIPFPLQLQLDKNIIKKLLQYTIMAITGIVTAQLTLIFIRSLIIEKYDDFNAGIWDSTWRISAIYYTFLITSFKFYLLPTFSKLQSNQFKKEVLKIWKLTLPAILLITGVIYIGKDFFIKLLFTEEFYAIGSILLFQLIGDVFKIHTWTLDNILIAQAKTTKFILLEISWALSFCIGGILLTDIFELQGITIAYAMACVFNFILINIVLYPTLWKTQKNN